MEKKPASSLAAGQTYAFAHGGLQWRTVVEVSAGALALSGRTVPVIDFDRTSAKISQRKVKAILRKTFEAAVRGGEHDVTLWDDYGNCLAHWSCDPQPYRKQTTASCFSHPLSR